MPSRNKACSIKAIDRLLPCQYRHCNLLKTDPHVPSNRPYHSSLWPHYGTPTSARQCKTLRFHSSIRLAVQLVQTPVKQWWNSSTDHSLTNPWLTSTRLMPSLMVGARTLWYLAKLTTSFPSVPTLTLNSSNTLAVRVLRVRFLTNLELLWRTKGDVGVHVVLSLADKAKSKSLMWKWYNNHIEFNINNINEKSNNLNDRAHIWLHNTW